MISKYWNSTKKFPVAEDAIHGISKWQLFSHLYRQILFITIRVGNTVANVSIHPFLINNTYQKCSIFISLTRYPLIHPFIRTTSLPQQKHQNYHHKNDSVTQLNNRSQSPSNQEKKKKKEPAMVNNHSIPLRNQRAIALHLGAYYYFFSACRSEIIHGADPPTLAIIKMRTGPANGRNLTISWLVTSHLKSIRQERPRCPKGTTERKKFGAKWLEWAVGWNDEGLCCVF